MESQTITAPETKEIEVVGLNLHKKAFALQIVDTVSYETGGELLAGIKAQINKIKPQLDEPCEKANQLHKWLTGLRWKVLNPFLNAESEVKRKLAAYQWKQEEKRRREDEKNRAKAQIEAEAKRKAEIEAAKKAKDKEALAELKAAPIVPEMTQLPKTPEPPKLEGTSFRTVWKFRIIDVNKIPRKHMVPNEQSIGQVVRALGKNAGIDGIEIYPEQIVSSRAGK